MNTEYGLDQLLMTNMDSPRLAVTLLNSDLRQMNGILEVMSAMYDCRTGWDFPNLTLPRLTVARLNWMT